MKDDLAAVIAVIRKLLDDARRYHAQQAEQHGYALDEFNKLPTVLQKLDAEQRQQLYPAFNTFRLFLETRQQQAQPSWDVGSGAFSLTSTTTAAVAPVNLNDMLRQYFPRHPLSWSPERSQQYATRLEEIEPEASKVYRSVAEAFWGSAENPERSALFQLRQCFDHLFAHLAPDDAVRASKFFQRKAPPKETQVHRRERIMYAAHTHIEDKARADFLAEQADTLLEFYEKLQRAHERSPLDRDQTRLTIEGMIASIEQWIDALSAAN